MVLVEREGELATLWRQFAATQDGGGRIVLLPGEAGVGKSALAHAFVEEAATRARVGWGVCDPLETPRPHGPLRDIAAAVGGELAASVDGTTSVEDLREHFLAFLTTRPVATVVVIEDLHWVDAATLDLLRFVARRLRDTRALLLLTYRDDELTPEHPLRSLLGDLAGSGAAIRVPVLPLSVEGLRQLAAEQDIDVASLHRLTGGNAFFATEVLAEEHDQLPATVRDAVLARASRLPTPARQVLDAVALARPPVPARMAMEVAGTGPEALDAAVGLGVLVTDGDGVAFRHDLARQVLDQAVLPGMRAQLHGRALAWLEGRPAADPTDLAHHALGTGDAAASLLHAQRAAEHATALGSHREAAAHYARALRYADALPPAELAALLERHSLACHVTDDADAAVASRSRAVALRRELGDPVQLGDGLRWLSRMSWIAGRNAEAEAHGREALAVLVGCGDCQPLAMAHSNLAQLAMLARDFHGALAHGAAAIELAERLGDTETVVHALNNVGAAELLAGMADVGLAKLERSLELAQHHGYADHAARAYCNLGAGMGEIRDYDVATTHVAAGIEFCGDRQLDYFGHYLRAWRARLNLERGHWVEAEEEALAVLDMPHVAAVTCIVALTVLGRLAVRRGQPDLASGLDDAWALAAETGDLQRTWPVVAGMAERAWWLGRPEEIDQLTGATFAQAVEFEHPWAIGELGYWRWRAGLLRRLPAAAAAPYQQLAHGSVGEAAAAWRSLGTPFEEATALAASADVADLERAHVLATDVGATALRDLVAQRLRDRGGPVPRGPRPSTRAHPAGLTPRQVDVLALVTEGLTDAEIAERLFISPKTAGHHVSAILRKLGLRNRVEIAVAAARLSGTEGT